MGFNKIPDRHTPFRKALMDKKSRELHRREEQEFSNPAKSQFQGKTEFEGTILNAPIIVAVPGSPTHKYVICRGRTDDIHGFSLSEPCEFQSGDPQKDAKLYTFVEGCHSETISKITVDDINALNLTSGDKINQTYKEGPGFNGRMRQPSFQPQRSGRSEGFNIPGCSARNALVAAGGGALTLGAAGGTIDNTPTLEFEGQEYQANIAEKLYEPRTSGDLYAPKIFVFDSSQRGPDYNGPKSVASAAWQIGGASYPLHPNRCRVTSPFAKMRDTGPHRGLDLGGGMGVGEPMYAMLEGKVLDTDTPNKSGCGGLVIIGHEIPGKKQDGSSLFITAMYMHCEAIYVKKGEMVTNGQHIADQGTTGHSTGPHLHLQVAMDSKSRSGAFNENLSVNPIVIFNFKFPYSSGTKAYIEKNNGEQITWGDYQIEGLQPGVQKTGDYVVPAGQSVGTSIDAGPGATELGENQARYYTPRSMEQAKQEITGIMLHSTDGSNKDGAAAAGIKRLAGYPTQSYKVTANYKNAKSGTPDKSPVVTDGSPEGTTKTATDYAGRKITIVAKKVWTGSPEPKTELRWQKLTKISVHYFTDIGGNVVQGVLDKDKAWHGGSSWANKTCLSIEMCGQPNVGAAGGSKKEGDPIAPNPVYAPMYKEELLNATAKLCATLCARWNIPIKHVTKQEPGICGHDSFSNDRSDPGTKTGNFDWTDFMSRVSRYASGVI